MDQYEYVVRFVAEVTRTKAGRELSEGLQVYVTPKGFVYGLGRKEEWRLSRPTWDFYRMYDNLLHTPLSYLAREGIRDWVRTVEEIRHGR